MTPPDEETDLRAALAVELRRVPDRLRSLSTTRLQAELPTGETRLDLARAVAQRLADAAAVIEARPGAAPVRRTVPVLAPYAVADQVAVTGADLLRAAEGRADDEPVGGAEDEPVRRQAAAAEEPVRRTVADVLAEALADVVALRRAL